MDIQLYVYDLTHGMARNMSKQFLGIQIDAVYHTAIVFNGIEYFFGAGVQTSYAGSTHHGRPMEIVSLGKCNLPLDVIMEYLESLKETYTPESYDLFAHNCNNFSNDFATFLVGKGIPSHITNLPQQVLNTPFGQMLKPQLDASMRTVTQAPVPQHNIPQQPVHPKTSRYGKVVNTTSQTVLERHLSGAMDTCATIFFTSATCPPCKLAYPTYDSLAEEYVNALFLKVDINDAQEIAQKWQIQATPTFCTRVAGRTVDTWSGADPRLLKLNVEKAYSQAFPPHPHKMLDVPKLQFGSLKASTYPKIPPLDKLTAKLGAAGRDPSIVKLKTFIERRQEDPKNASLPDLSAIGQAYCSSLLQLPIEVQFAAVDLLRCAVIDQRVSGFYAEETSQRTILACVEHALKLSGDCPHNLRLVTIHLACNCFSSQLFVKELMKSNNQLLKSIVQLVTSSLLDNAHSTTRVAASSLAFNIATTNYRLRREEQREGMNEGAQVELAASILECIPHEENDEALKGLLLTLAYLLYFSPLDGELVDLCGALEAKNILQGLKGQATVVQEVVKLL